MKKKKSHSIYMDIGKGSEKKEKIERATIPLFLKDDVQALCCQSKHRFNVNFLICQGFQIGVLF